MQDCTVRKSRWRALCGCCRLLKGEVISERLCFTGKSQRSKINRRAGMARGSLRSQPSPLVVWSSAPRAGQEKGGRMEKAGKGIWERGWSWFQMDAGVSLSPLCFPPWLRGHEGKGSQQRGFVCLTEGQRGRSEWGRKPQCFTQCFYFIFVHFIKGWAKNWNLSTHPGEPAESISVCITSTGAWELSIPMNTPKLEGEAQHRHGDIGTGAGPRSARSRGPPAPLLRGDAPREGFGLPLGAVSLVRAVPRASGATGWRVDTSRRGRAGSVEKKKKKTRQK